MQEIVFDQFTGTNYDIKVLDPSRLSDEEKNNIRDRKYILHTIARTVVVNNEEYNTDMYVSNTRNVLCKLLNGINSLSIYFVIMVAQQILYKKSPFFWFMFYNDLCNLLVSMYEKVPVYCMVEYIYLIKQFSQSLSVDWVRMYKNMPSNEEMKKQEFRIWDIVKSLSRNTFSYYYKGIFNDLFFVKYNQDMYITGLALDIYIDPADKNFSAFYNYAMLAIYDIAHKTPDSGIYYKQLTECVVCITKTRSDTINFLNNHINIDISKIVWIYIPLAPLIIPYATNITTNDPDEKIRFLDL